MPIVPKLEAFLAKNHVSYTHTIHPLAYTARGVATAEHLPPHEVAKSVVFVGDDGVGIAVLPADAVVDLQQLRDALGVNRLRLATESELAGLFPDSELGAMPPFGNLYNIPVYVDRELAAEEWIAFNAGTHRDVVHMRYADFAKLTEPLVFGFSHVR